MTLLAEILEHKLQELAARRAVVPDEVVERAAGRAPAPRDFHAALRAAGRRPALIAEVKRASPSKGVMALHFDPLALARAYAANGAAAISVLTDERYFGGSLEHLRQIAALPGRPPLLRKDFVLEPYQVFEARAAGADAVLLIAAALDEGTLAELQQLAGMLQMAALVEVHDEGELARALALRSRLIGINNRNLADFSVSLETTLRLAPLVPERVLLVSESGIAGREQVGVLQAAKRPGGRTGVDAILVGEALIRAGDPAAAVRALVGPATMDPRVREGQETG